MNRDNLSPPDEKTQKITFVFSAFVSRTILSWARVAIFLNGHAWRYLPFYPLPASTPTHLCGCAQALDVQFSNASSCKKAPCVALSGLIFRSASPHA